MGDNINVILKQHAASLSFLFTNLNMISNSTTKVSEHIIIELLAGLCFVWILQGTFLRNYKLVLHFSSRAHCLRIANARMGL